MRADAGVAEDFGRCRSASRVGEHEARGRRLGPCLKKSSAQQPPFADPFAARDIFLSLWLEHSARGARCVCGAWDG
jgi:hypothetical protein